MPGGRRAGRPVSLARVLRSQATSAVPRLGVSSLAGCRHACGGAAGAVRGLLVAPAAQIAATAIQPDTPILSRPVHAQQAPGEHEMLRSRPTASSAAPAARGVASSCPRPALGLSRRTACSSSAAGPAEQCSTSKACELAAQPVASPRNAAAKALVARARSCARRAGEWMRQARLQQLLFGCAPRAPPPALRRRPNRVAGAPLSPPPLPHYRYPAAPPRANKGAITPPATPPGTPPSASAPSRCS